MFNLILWRNVDYTQENYNIAIFYEIHSRIEKFDKNYENGN